MEPGAGHKAKPSTKNKGKEILEKRKKPLKGSVKKSDWDNGWGD